MHEVVNVRDPASGSGSPPAKAARRTGAGGPSAGLPVIHW
jgi:hypothetical protein